MREIILALIGRRRLQALYLFFGFLTAAIDQTSFMILLRILPGMYSAVPAVASWVIAVSFAYVANRKWVFRTQSARFRALLREAASFYVARIFSLLVSIAIMWLLVDVGGYNADLTKLTSSVLVTILNYVFSKFWVFRRGR